MTSTVLRASSFLAFMPFTVHGGPSNAHSTLASFVVAVAFVLLVGLVTRIVANAQRLLAVERANRRDGSPYRLSWATLVFYTFVGHTFEFVRTPKLFITQFLGAQANREGFALGETLPRMPHVFVPGSDPRLRKQTGNYGEGGAAKIPYDPSCRDYIQRFSDVIDVQARTIAQMVGSEAKRERHAILRALHPDAALCKDLVFLVEKMLGEWDERHSYLTHIRFVVVNLVSRNVLGLPVLLSFDDVRVFEEIEEILIDDVPFTSERVKSLHRRIDRLNRDVLDGHFETIAQSSKYVAAFLKNGSWRESVHEGKSARTADEMSDDERRELLFALKPVGSLFASNNSVTAASLLVERIFNTPDILERLRDESAHIDFAAAPESEEDYQRLMSQVRQLSYLDCTVKEALRFGASSTVFVKQTSRATTWSVRVDARAEEEVERQEEVIEVALNTRSRILTLNRMNAHNPHVWEHPERFEPTRFETRSAHDARGFAPFNLGVRMCPAAKEFVPVFMKLLTLFLVKNYDLTFNGEAPHIPSWSVHVSVGHALTVTVVNKRLNQ